MKTLRLAFIAVALLACADRVTSPRAVAQGAAARHDYIVSMDSYTYNPCYIFVVMTDQGITDSTWCPPHTGHPIR